MPAVPAVPANGAPAPPSYGPRYYQPPGNGQHYYQPPASSLPPAGPRDPVASNNWRPAPGDAWRSDSRRDYARPPSTRLLPPSDESKVMPPPADEPLPPKRPSTDDKSPDYPVDIDKHQFEMVSAMIYSGLKPYQDGWLWLKDRGFRTVLHLRPPGQDDTASEVNATSKGLKYLTLEVSPQKLNRDLVDQFASIVNDKKNYPLYVYASRGMPAGTMWYLHFKLIENAPDAKARALKLGLSEDVSAENDKDWWLAINRLIPQ